MTVSNPFPVLPSAGLGALLLLLVVIVVYHVRRMRRAWNADHVGNCSCGYPIGGLQIDRCPECGKVHEGLTRRISRQRMEAFQFLCSSGLLLWIAASTGIAVAQWILPPALIGPQVLVLRTAVGELTLRWDVVVGDHRLSVEKLTITQSSIPGAPEAPARTVTIWSKSEAANQGAASSNALDDALSPIVESVAEVPAEARIRLGLSLVSVVRLTMKGADAEKAAAKCRTAQAFSSVLLSPLPMQSVPRFPNWPFYSIAGLVWLEFARRVVRSHWVKPAMGPVP